MRFDSLLQTGVREVYESARSDSRSDRLQDTLSAICKDSDGALKYPGISLDEGPELLEG
jgi:hypothetical protein